MTAKELLEEHKNGRTDFSWERFGDEDFRDAKLDGCEFRCCRFDGTNFAGASLVKCNFDAAKGKFVNFQFADLRGAKWTGDFFDGARLYGAKMTKSQIANLARLLGLEECDNSVFFNF